jgi:hypothetical protein
MIPSRPLNLVEIVGETFSIYRRIFLRYAGVFLLLVVPGICLTTYATLTATQNVIGAAHHAGAFDDSDLTQLRNDIRHWLEEQNPLLTAGLPAPRVDSTLATDTTRREATASLERPLRYIREHITDLSSDFLLLGAAFLVLLIGTFAAITATIDLASQTFEERPLEFGYSLRASLLGHAWKALFLYLLYIIATSILDQVLVGIDSLSKNVGDAIAGFVSVAQIYVLIRLVALLPALVSEELGPFRAVLRSWHLTRRSGWRIFAVSAGFAIILFVVTMIVTAISGIFFGGVYTWWSDFLSRDTLTITWLLRTLPDFVTSVAGEVTLIALLLFGLLFVFATVLYYDLRTRRDGPLVYLEEVPETVAT